MRTRLLFKISAMLAVVVLALSVSQVFACNPDNEGTRCTFTRPNSVATRAAALARAAAQPTPKPAPVAAVKRGNGPADAIDPADAWDTIQPGASIWYKVDRPQNSNLTLWLDANSNPGVQMAIYSPDQIADLGTVPPKGRATPNKLDNRHDQWWVGQSPSGGTWYGVVTNHTTSALAYKVGTDLLVTGPKGCQSYWEYIGSEAVYWTACR